MLVRGVETSQRVGKGGGQVPKGGITLKAQESQWIRAVVMWPHARWTTSLP